MSGKKDWIGHKFSNFEVIAFDEKSYKKDTERVKNGEIKRFNRKYLCRCNCENIVSVTANNIKRGTPNSCGYRYIDLKYSEIQDKSYKNKLIKFIKEGEKDECNTKNNEHITRNGL